MNDTTTISVIVVSQGRPDHLRRCLLGLSQQYYKDFEVIVVADEAGCKTAAKYPSAKTQKTDIKNISAARNLGIKQAAGTLIAFIDDDAVPEPTWLCNLSEAFKDQGVAAATGFVRGRNGISFQWRGRLVNGQSQTLPITTKSDDPMIVGQQDGWVLKLEGTNMMFRAAVLREIGGFDERLHFYLDETDVGVRLGLAGYKMALCPMAQVHHGFAASQRRTQSRAPKSLVEIGASLAIYLNKYHENDDYLAEERTAQRKRLLRFMVKGELAPSQIEPLLDSFDVGVAQAKTREITMPKLACAANFKTFATSTHDVPTQFLTGRPWQRKQLMAQAQSMLAMGQRAHIFVFSPTALFHRIDFTEAGVWVQAGGIFGRSDRNQPLVQRMTFNARAAHEKCSRKTLQHPKIPQ